MKAKPKRPKKGTERITWHLDEGETLESVARYFIDSGIHPSDVKVVREYDNWDDDESYYFCGTRSESDEKYNSRLARYEAQMRAYDEWHEENRQLIEEELERRRLEAEEKKRKDEEKALKRLEKSRKVAEKQLAKIDKQLADIKDK